MANQTINLGNFGQSGFLPDVAPSLLPQTGFSYSRNWRFKKGGHAEVSEGYTNVYETRAEDDGNVELGKENSDFTFLYTWELANDNAVVVYDGENQNFFMTENAGMGGITEYNLSIENITTYDLEYDSTGEDTPASGMMSVSASGNLYVGFDTALEASTAAANVETFKIIAIVDDSKNKPFGNDDLIPVSVGSSIGTVMKVSFAEPLDGSRIADGTNLVFQVGQQIEHDALGKFKWDGTDALGVPVFNNEVEAPWEFVDAPLPYIKEMNNWPSGGICKQLSSFGVVLVAVGYSNDEADVGFKGNNRTLAFSNPILDAGELPTWTFQDLESQAQIIDLSLYTDGALVSAYEAQGRLIVNSTTDVMAITDNRDGTYSAVKLEIGGGVLSKRTSVAISNGFFSIGNGQFYIHDTNTYQSIGHGQYSETWFNTVDEERLDEIQVIYDPRTRTVWIKTPTSEVAQEIWIIDLENNYTLSVLDDHQEIKFMEWSAEGTPAVTLTWDTIPAPEWDLIQQNSWNEFPVIELGEYRNRILSAGGRGVFVHDYGLTYNKRPIAGILEKSYFKLGAGNSHETFQFDRLVPWVEGETGSELSIRVGSANSLGDSIRHTNYKTYRIGTTEKLDFRRQAKWGSMTFYSTTSGTMISGVEIIVNSASRR